VNEASSKIACIYDESVSGASVYNYYRDYSPEIGRYIESDPIGLRGGLNTYAYGEENPTNVIDPLGLHGNGTAGFDAAFRASCKCPVSPLAPCKADVNANIKEASKHINPMWYWHQMESRGPWDYKTQGQGSKFADFGNFNYGAVGNSYGGFGLPDQFLLRFAGWYEEFRTPGAYDPIYGHFWEFPPYGDNPIDQLWIQKGIQYARCRCDQRQQP
jgi:RHS repeat-associated protein